MFWKCIVKNLQSIDMMTTNRKSAISGHKKWWIKATNFHFWQRSASEQDYTRNFNHIRTGYLQKKRIFARSYKPQKLLKVHLILFFFSFLNFVCDFVNFSGRMLEAISCFGNQDFALKDLLSWADDVIVLILFDEKVLLNNTILDKQQLLGLQSSADFLW